MLDQITQLIILYVGDAFELLLFIIGFASIIEYFAKRQFARLFVNIEPRQLAIFIFAQIAVLLLALLAFKYVVLSGGPGIAVHSILKTGAFTRAFSIVSLSLAIGLCLVGLVRVARIFRRVFVLRRH